MIDPTETDALRAEIAKLRHEVSQKQLRENRLVASLERCQRRVERLHAELDASRALLQTLGLPRKELAEVGRRLLRIFGDEP